MKFIAVLTLIFGLLALPLFSAAQEEPTYDPGIQGAIDAGMITEVEESQTIDDKTVTLHWVYADVQRFAISYTVRGIENPSEGDFTSPYWMPEVMLTDTRSDAAFSFSSSWGLPAEDGVLFYNSFYSQAMRPSAIDNDYFINEYGTLPETLTLKVAVTLKLQSPNMMEPPTETVGAFEFTVEVPLGHIQTLQPALTVETNDITVRLEEVSIAPSQTSVTLCYTLPDQQDWQPDATLTINDQVGQSSGWGMTERPDPADTERCFKMDYAIFHDGEPTTLNFTLDRIQTSEPTETLAFWEQVEVEMAKQGIEINYSLDHAVIREVIRKPADMTEEEMYQIEWEIRNDLRPSIIGSWVFEIEIPSE